MKRTFLLLAATSFLLTACGSRECPHTTVITPPGSSSTVVEPSRY